MKPEELKIIAEGMGYKTCSNGDYGFIAYDCMDENNEYNPITNNDQMVEIMERLKIGTKYNEYDKCWEHYWRDENKSLFIIQGKTINEAVCKAALEYFKLLYSQ